MQKPTIFFSHSSKDAQPLANLKNLINSRTGQAVDIFLSSDGQSIPFGSNWVHKIEEALTDSTIMFVFISPNSINSKWIYFESGFAYSKGVDVIPVGILGVNLDQLSPPLSLLQGFNLDKTDALGNIIAKINEKYNYDFNTEFSEKEFTQTLQFRENQTITKIIKDLQFSIEYKKGEPISPLLESALSSNDIEFIISGESIWGNGMQIYCEHSIADVFVDGLMLVEKLEIIQEVISKNNLSIKDDNVRLHFEPRYRLSSKSYLRQTALLKNTGIRIEKGNEFNYQNIRFKLASIADKYGGDIMDIVIKHGSFNGLWVNEVCKIFLDNGVIIVNPKYDPYPVLVPRVGLTND